MCGGVHYREVERLVSVESCSRGFLECGKQGVCVWNCYAHRCTVSCCTRYYSV